MTLPLPPKADPLKNSPIKKAGFTPALVVVAKITRVDAATYTASVRSVFDNHAYDNVQISSPYQHIQGGAGLYIQPKEGAVCCVVVPSDSSPPFLLCYLSPLRSDTNKAASNQEPTETTEQGVALEQAQDQQLVDAQAAPRGKPSFDGNRPASDSGDGNWRGHNGNFITLYDSGILALGATPLAQRIYLPLTDKVLDVAGEYEMKHPGGGVHWGVTTRPSSPVAHTSSWRLLADEDFATIRLSIGTVTPLGEPDGDAGETTALAELGVGAAEDVCWELSATPGGTKGFDPEKKGMPSTDEVRQASVFRALFDKKGGAFLRAAGSALFSIKKSLRIKAGETLMVLAKKWSISADPDTGEAVLDGGAALSLKGKVIQCNGGGRPASGVGDQVEIAVPPFNITGTLNGQPFTGVATLVAGTARGEIVTGSETVRIP